MKRKWIIMRIVKVALFVGIGIFLFGYITMSLWNCLIPTLFKGPMVTYWQAIGLLILGKILFGGFGGHHRRGPWGRGGGWGPQGGPFSGPGGNPGWSHCEQRAAWNGGNPWSRWHHMTPEEREKYKEQWKTWKEGLEALKKEKREWKDKFKNATPDERKKMEQEWKERWKNHCSYGSRPDEREETPNTPIA